MVDAVVPRGFCASAAAGIGGGIVPVAFARRAAAGIGGGIVVRARGAAPRLVWVPSATRAGLSISRSSFGRGSVMGGWVGSSSCPWTLPGKARPASR